MIIRPRIIPTLLIDNQKLVKTVKFKKPDYLGDPINAIKIFNEKGVDELCLLDITITKEKRKIDYGFLHDAASEAFMPLSYGGGIKSVEEIEKILAIGFEKVVINTSLSQNEELVKDSAAIFGSQSVVASIDYKRDIYIDRCYIRDGSQRINCDALELAKKAEQMGAGEILLYSINHDGTGKGYDIKTIKKISENVAIPVIACGGAGSLKDIRQVLCEGRASAAAAGSLFVYFGNKKAVLINFPDEQTLFEEGIYRKQ